MLLKSSYNTKFDVFPQISEQPFIPLVYRLILCVAKPSSFNSVLIYSYELVKSLFFKVSIQ